MASFCRSRTDWPRSVFASDLAALEWALVEALHAETLPALTLADLQSFAGRSWADAKLVPNPAVRLVSTEYPVNGFFQAFRDEETPSIPARTASTVAVFRQEYTIARKELAGTEEVVLRALLSGTSVGASLALAAERLPSPLDGNAVGGWFRSWFSNGFFIAIEGSTD